MTNTYELIERFNTDANVARYFVRHIESGSMWAFHERQDADIFLTDPKRNMSEKDRELIYGVDTANELG